MSQLEQLETKLNDIFGKEAPALPEGGKKFLVDVAPWITLFGGVVSFLAGLSLWRSAHAVDSLTDYANRLCATYALDTCGSIRHLSFWVYLSVASLVIMGVLYILAFPKLRARSKQGWNLLFYIALLDIVLAVFRLFDGYGGVGNFIGMIIGSAISFYLLFQVRSYYLGKAPKIASKA